jgi:hypothetical protein
MLNDRLPVLADYHFTPPLLFAGDDGGAEGALPPHTARAQQQTPAPLSLSIGVAAGFGSIGYDAEVSNKWHRGALHELH